MYSATCLFSVARPVVIRSVAKNLDKLYKFETSNIFITSVCREYNMFSDNSINMAKSNQDLFKGKIDRYSGITVKSDQEDCVDKDFQHKLEESLKYWSANGYRGIWFHINLKHAGWVPILAQKGFKFHHANEDYVMMYLWLPTKENCNIPNYAHTMLGVGAVVVNKENQVLVVQEKYNVLNRPFWKLPGGYVEPGENLIDAAIREVHEETNISTEFESVLTMRHAHGGMFGLSDIYTVISLRPISFEIQKCEQEIKECKWMDIDEYLNHPDIHDLNKFQLQKFLEYKKCNIKINCHHDIHQILKKPYTVYSVTKADLNNEEGSDVSNSKI